MQLRLRKLVLECCGVQPACKSATEGANGCTYEDNNLEHLVWVVQPIAVSPDFYAGLQSLNDPSNGSQAREAGHRGRHQQRDRGRRCGPASLHRPRATAAGARPRRPARHPAGGRPESHRPGAQPRGFLHVCIPSGAGLHAYLGCFHTSLSATLPASFTGPAAKLSSGVRSVCRCVTSHPWSHCDGRGTWCCQVIVIDEISTVAEVRAVKSIAQVRISIQLSCGPSLTRPCQPRFSHGDTC